jgi:uroporphyrin-III C-methyltransferase/precorrin-2 dehydrogenase/sirohydrochlorin ferrochelatase
VSGYYPVLLDLRGRRAVVVGGGAVAEAKVGPLVDAGAAVTVVAPALTAGLALRAREGRVAHVARSYTPGDLEGARIVIAATDEPDVNHAVYAEAESRGIPVNVVDDPPYCGFILPSILRRGELVVAVSTSGNAPALAVRIRERIERELGDEYARFLALAGALRKPLAEKHPDFQVRKRLWYRLVDSDVLALLRAGDEPRARQRIAEIMGVVASDEIAARAGSETANHRGTEARRRNDSNNSNNNNDELGASVPLWFAVADARPGPDARAAGRVYLVGAGPGDPRLITARGLEVLRRADVVVYDRLVSPALLDEAPADAELVYAGKAPGGHCMQQEGINALLVREAQLGKAVVRLKGGDPFVFGRGAEEAVACAEAGVSWEVVPGVSSVVGVTARAGIPVTTRGYGGSFAVATAHRAEDGTDPLDWGALARMDTLVVLMGVERLGEVVEQLRAHGRTSETPIALVENGTLPGERVVVGTLADIVERAGRARVQPPAVIVVGEVVRLRAVLAETAAAAWEARHVA